MGSVTKSTPSAKERIRDAAEQHVYEHGFSATTLDAILDGANASKGAFFHHFESKEAFVSFIYERGPGVPSDDDVIVRSIEYWRDRIHDKLEEAAADHPRLQEADLESLADQVFTIFEGGFVLARATNDWSHLTKQLAHLRRYLELLVAD